MQDLPQRMNNPTLLDITMLDNLKYHLLNEANKYNNDKPVQNISRLPISGESIIKEVNEQIIIPT